jgi:hypothetical protein
MRTCSIESCDSKHYGKGYCKKHYQKLIHLKDCKVDGCEASVKAKGFCDKHYKLFRKYGVPKRVKRPEITNTICLADGCKSAAKTKGYCGAHYARIIKHGDPLKGGSYQTGITTHPAYKRWDAMMQRCYNPNTKWYHNYGGKGVTVCERWHSSKNFIEDMADLFKKHLTLDRIDNSKGYSPDNCRWVDRKAQTRNRKATILDETKVIEIRKLLAKGIKQTKIAPIYNVSAGTIADINTGRTWKDV